MNNINFAIPEIYGDSLSYYEVLRELIEAMNVIIDNYDTIPEQIADAVKNLDAAKLFSAVLDQLIDTIATDNTKSNNAVKVYKKHDLLYATFNETVNLYESLIDFTSGTETELIVGTNIREVNISELFIELRKLIDNEAQSRTQGDTELQTNIDNEAQARTRADTALQTNIDNEAQARTQGDTALQTNIDNEAQARTQGDTALQNAINAEKSAREQGDTNLQNKIDNGTLKIELLWTNSNTNSNFDAQTINLSLTNYKMFYFEVIRQKNMQNELHSYILLNDNKTYFLSVYENVNIGRKVELRSNSIIVDDCYFFQTYGSSSTMMSNDHCIPYRIYGIK